jgi:hypothetical protein
MYTGEGASPLLLLIKYMGAARIEPLAINHLTYANNTTNHYTKWPCPVCAQ